MDTLIIVFIGSICLLIAQEILSQRFAKNWFLSFLKVISFVAINFSGFFWIILNENIFKDSNGLMTACVVVMALPWIIDNFLGAERVDGEQPEKIAL